MADRNFLSGINFRFAIDRLPNMEYYAQQANLPGISINTVETVQSPFGQNPLHGDKIEFSPLSVTVRIDEDMDMYLEIYDWMRSLADPNRSMGEIQSSTSKYDVLRRARGIYSDASLIILNNTMNPGIEVKFYDMFPTNIGDLQFNTTDSDVAAVTTDITFQYRFFDIKKVA